MKLSDGIKVFYYSIEKVRKIVFKNVWELWAGTLKNAKIILSRCPYKLREKFAYYKFLKRCLTILLQTHR